MGTYVITGGAGFIGTALAAHLGRAGHEVRVLDNLSGRQARPRAAMLSDLPRVRFIEGSVCDPEDCRRACTDAEYVLHHAAGVGDDPAVCAEVIIGGTIQMLEAACAAGTVKRFVCASSGAVYGDTPAISKHEAAQTDPITPEAAALLSAEHFCRSAFRLHGLQTVALRYFDVYGPGQETEGDNAPAIARLLRAAAGGDAATVFGDGELSRDYVYIDDVVQANLRAVTAQRGVGGKVFNIGGGQRLSLNQLREMLERLTGRPVPVEYTAARPGDVRHLRADISAAAGMLQFTPSVGLEDGLARTLHWIRANAG